MLLSSCFDTGIPVAWRCHQNVRLVLPCAGQHSTRQTQEAIPTPEMAHVVPYAWDRQPETQNPEAHTRQPNVPEGPQPKPKTRGPSGRVDQVGASMPGETIAGHGSQVSDTKKSRY